MKTQKQIIDYTDNELNTFEIIQDDVIIKLFETRDKRYCILKALKKAYQMGLNRIKELEKKT